MMRAVCWGGRVHAGVALCPDMPLVTLSDTQRLDGKRDRV